MSDRMMTFIQWFCTVGFLFMVWFNQFDRYPWGDSWK